LAFLVCGEKLKQSILRSAIAGKPKPIPEKTPVSTDALHFELFFLFGNQQALPYKNLIQQLK